MVAVVNKSDVATSAAIFVAVVSVDDSDDGSSDGSSDGPICASSLV